jgi:equilibrative nucleoside transporter 1/2/3
MSAREVRMELHSDIDSCNSSTSSLSATVPLPRIIFCFLGGLTLLGWNIILAFTGDLDKDMLGGKTWGGSGWAFWCAICNSVMVNVVQGVASTRAFRECVPFVVSYIAGCVLLFASLIGLVYLKVATDGDSVDKVFVAALVLVCVQGTSSALLASAVFALAGSIHPKLTMDAMIGQGLAGVLSAVLGFMAAGSEPGLCISFVLCALFGAAGIPVYFLRIKKDSHVSARETPPDSPQLGPRSALSSPSGVVRRSSSSQLLRQGAWPQCFTVCFVFVVTFIVFPGVTSRWRGGHVAADIAVFQLFDVVGRFAPHLEFFHVRRGGLVTSFSLLRGLFLPAFFFVERSQAAFSTNFLVQFSLMVAFAFTNGWVSTLSMMLGPGQRGLDIDDAAPVGSLMAFFLVLGIFLGSLLALAAESLLTSIFGAPP